MSVSCPNKNTAEWKAMVSSLGETNAYKVWLANGEQLISLNEIEGYKKALAVEVPKEPKTLFGLNTKNEKELEFHINTLNVVGQFLESIGIEQRLVPEFLSENGSVVEGAIAAANFINGTVDIIDDINKGRAEAWNKLPEEAAHFWYRLLDTNSPLKDALLTSAATTRKEDELRDSLYGDVYDGPKVIGRLALDENGNILSKPALSPIREEAIGQLIAEAIKRIENKSANAADYSFLEKFIEWVNSIISKFKSIEHDPFEVAAMKILSSDTSDLMTWDEYRKVNNIVNFADVLTEQSVAPIDYTIIEDLVNVVDIADNDYMLEILGKNENVIDRVNFTSKEEVDAYVLTNFGKEHDNRQKTILQEVIDNQKFFDRLLNKSFRKKSKYLPKTLRKYFTILDSTNLSEYVQWIAGVDDLNLTKKLSQQEKEQLINTNGYTNIAPTLKVLPDLLQKYGRKITPEIIKQEIEITNKLIKKEITKEQATELRQKLENKKKGNPIVLSEPIKIDGAKKQELSILNGIKDLIKLENPKLRTITVEEFVAEAHNWLETNYLLGFANEKKYLTYRVDQIFNSRLKPSVRPSDNIYAEMPTEEEIMAMDAEERQNFLRAIGLKENTGDIYHNKISLRFNDMYHLRYGHFDKSPSAWGNLTYFYTGKSNQKDAVLLHEIQNDNIEHLRDYKNDKNSLDEEFAHYLQHLNAQLVNNINTIENGGKTIEKYTDGFLNGSHRTLSYLLRNHSHESPYQGWNAIKEFANEQLHLYQSSGTTLDTVKKQLDEGYSKKRKFTEFQKRGGIKSLLDKKDLEELKDIITRLNTENIMTEPEFLPEENQYEPGYPTIRNLSQKKKQFYVSARPIVEKINAKFEKLYGDKNVPRITLDAPAKPLPKNQRRNHVLNANTTRERRIGNASKELNDNINYLLLFSEKKILNNLSDNIDFSKKQYIQARNAEKLYNFNKGLSKITLEQYTTLIENFKYNQDLFNRLVDEQAQKDITSPELEKKSKAKSIVNYLEKNPDKKIGDKYNFIWGVGHTLKGMVYVEDASKSETNENAYLDNWTEEEFIEYLEKTAPEYLNLNTKEIDIKNQQFKFNEIKQKALDKKKELDEKYGTLEKEIKNTLEIEMNYFTPLVHHLIQKHIKQHGKDFPMYFSGYNITNLTQGNKRTALIYAGKDEIDIVDKKQFTIKGVTFYKNSDNSILKRENDKVVKANEQEYQKAYQQATEQRAKEIKYEAAKELGLIQTASTVPYREDEKVSLEEGVKRLNDYKKQSSDNLNRVIGTIMSLTNNKPIETGAIYNAMSQISGIKLIWQDKIDGINDTNVGYDTVSTGGYLVDLSNYNYNVPILYGLQKNKNKKDTPTFLSDLTSHLKEQLKLSSKKVSFLQRNMILKRLKNYNRLHGTRHGIDFKQIGTQANQFEWELKENWNGYNPAQKSLFQLNSDESIPKEYISNKLEEILGRFGITVERMDKVLFNNKTVVALADITNKIIKVTSGLENAGTLPEEAGHFFMELLGRDNPLFKRLVDLAKESDRYKEIYDDYYAIYKNDEDVAIEAAGKLLSEALRNNLEASKENKNWISRFVATAKRVFEIVKNKLKGVDRSELQDLLDLFASNVVSGQGDIYSMLSADNLTETEKNVAFAQIELNTLKKTVEKIKSGLVVKQAITSSKPLPKDITSLMLSINLNQIYDNIENLQGIDMLIKFVEYAVEDLDYINSSLQHMLDQQDISGLSVEALQELYEQTMMYEILDDITGIVDYSSPELTKLKDIIHKTLNPIRQRIKTEYRIHGSKLIADKYSYLLRNTPISTEQLHDALLQTSGDIGWLRMMTGSVSESNDLVLQVISNIVQNQKNKVTKTVQTVVNRLDEAVLNYTEKTGKAVTDDLWDFIIMKDENGKPNGRYHDKPEKIGKFTKHPLNHKYYQERKQLIEDLNKATTPQERIAAVNKHFKKAWLLTESDMILFYGREDGEIIKDFTKFAAQDEDYKDYTYERLDANKKELYDAWYNLKKELDTYVPNNKRIKNVLPQVKKGFIDSIKDNTAAWKEETLAHFDLTVDPNSKTLYKLDGQEAKFIPIHYTGLMSDPNKIETDLFKSLVLYADMAINNKLMHDIQGDISMIQNLVAQRDVIQMKSGNPVVSYLKKQTYVPTLKGEQTNTFRQLKEFIEMNVYGETQTEEIVNLLGKDLNVGQIANMINSYTAFKGLALNVFSSVSNVTYGRVQRMGEALSGEHYTPKDWAWANKLYFSNSGKVLAESTSRVPKSKYTMFVRNLDIAYGYEQGIKERGADYNTNHSIRKMLFRLSNLFVLNNVGENMLQVTTGLAVAKNFKLDNGRIANLWEEATPNFKTGKLIFPSDVTDNDINRYKRLVKSLNRTMDGAYNASDRAIAQRYAVGRMAFLFRKFLIPTFDKRWKNSKDAVYNLGRNKMEEGFYISFGKFIQELTREMKASGIGLSSTRKAWNDTPDFRKAGVIKASYEMGMILVCALILGLLEGELDDEDPEVLFAIYQVNRLYTEMGAFFPLTAPSDFFKLVKSPAAGINTVQDITRLIQDLAHPFEEYEGGKHAGDSRMYWHTIKMIPLINQYEKTQDIKQQIKNLQVTF